MVRSRNDMLYAILRYSKLYYGRIEVGSLEKMKSNAKHGGKNKI